MTQDQAASPNSKAAATTAPTTAATTTPGVGISAFASYLPSYRVSLQDWCEWSGEQWGKIQQVVGHSFRMGAANENANTMAASAVLRLIRQNQIDPARVNMLALGTESSTDNAAGAVVIKGMVDKGLAHYGLPPLSRACEVPEFKHACLGGVYAMKAAARYLAVDGQQQQAIVVSADVAEYAIGSSGEPTQGAGAVAMLMEADPKLLSLDLHQAGSASAYRGVDFRKPLGRFAQQRANAFGQLNDFPVFNGKYSTTCYIDEVLAAMRQLFARTSERPSQLLRRMAGIFLHRPYQRMAETGLVMSYLLALSLGAADDQAELALHADAAQVSVDALHQELVQSANVDGLLNSCQLSDELYPLATQTARAFRDSKTFAQLNTQLGFGAMQQVGNLYTASLPAWLAAGLEDAAQQNLDIAGQQLLAIGYGSGDAAEAIPMTVAPQWQQAAQHIGLAASLQPAQDISRAEYQALHSGAGPAEAKQPGSFYISRVGTNTAPYDDTGIEYYALTS